MLKSQPLWQWLQVGSGVLDVFFVPRMIFWMAVVMLLLPAPRNEPGQKDPSLRDLAAQAASAASAYCVANAYNCAAGLETVRTLAALPGRSTQPGNKTANSEAPRQIALRGVVLPPPRPAIE
jgi:hypothetical protein